MPRLLILLAAAGFVLAAPLPASTAPADTPGHQMQRKGSVPGHPGASGYAPGHLKKATRAHSARAFAPGHRKAKARSR